MKQIFAPGAAVVGAALGSAAMLTVISLSGTAVADTLKQRADVCALTLTENPFDRYCLGFKAGTSYGRTLARPASTYTWLPENGVIVGGSETPGSITVLRRPLDFGAETGGDLSRALADVLEQQGLDPNEYGVRLEQQIPYATTPAPIE